jgi:hypothetical protein
MYKIWNDNVNRETRDYSTFKRLETIFRAKEESYCVSYPDGRFFEVKYHKN